MKKSILLALLVLLSGAGLRAADFWEKKEYKQWKPKDVHKMLTKSPWAQNVSLDAMRMSREAFADIEGGPTQDPGARGDPDQAQGGGGRDAGFGGGGGASPALAAASVPVAVLARVVADRGGSPAPAWGAGARVREGGGHLPSM